VFIQKLFNSLGLFLGCFFYEMILYEIRYKGSSIFSQRLKTNAIISKVQMTLSVVRLNREWKYNEKRNKCKNKI